MLSTTRRTLQALVSPKTIETVRELTAQNRDSLRALTVQDVLHKLTVRDPALWRDRVDRYLDRAYRYLMAPIFAARWDAETGGRISERDLGLDETRDVCYGATPWAVIRVVFWLRRPQRTDVFVDVGSGKGRVLLEAARYPFRRVVGIEKAPQMMEIARENLERNRERLRCRDVTLIAGDVADCDLPSDTTIFFAYNPVREPTLIPLLHRMMALATERRESITFVYYNPVGHATVMGTGRARLVRATRPYVLFERMRLHIYEITPAPAANC